MRASHVLSSLQFCSYLDMTSFKMARRVYSEDLKVNDQLWLSPQIFPLLRAYTFSSSIKEENKKKPNSKLKVNKNANFFGSDFEFCTISLFVLLKYKIQMCPFSAKSKITLVYIAILFMYKPVIIIYSLTAGSCTRKQYRKFGGPEYFLLKGTVSRDENFRMKILFKFLASVKKLTNSVYFTGRCIRIYVQ
jgi:hypothetical protein